MSGPSERVKLTNLSLAAVLTSFAAWDPDTGVTDFLAMTHECLDQIAAGIAPADQGVPASAAGRPYAGGEARKS